MIYTILLSVLLSLVLVGCGSSRDSSSTVGDQSNGVVTLSGDAVVGGALSASISDDNGVKVGTESYQWFEYDRVRSYFEFSISKKVQRGTYCA